MQFEITDDAAIVFAQEFYAAIADGLPVDAAIGEARRAIFGQGNDIEWATPVVYLRGNGRLFDVLAAPPPQQVADDEEPTAAVDAAGAAGPEAAQQQAPQEPEPAPPAQEDLAPVAATPIPEAVDRGAAEAPVPAPIVPIWRRRPALFGAAAVVVLIAAFAAGIFVPGLSPWGGDGESSADLPSCDTVDASWTSFLDPGEHAVEIAADGGPLEFEVTDAHYRAFPKADKWEIVLSTVMWNMQTDVSNEPSHDVWKYGPLEVSRFPFDEKTCFFTDLENVRPDQKSRAQVGFTANEEPTGLVKLLVEVDGVEGIITVASN
jgi:hypothetical protein